MLVFNTCFRRKTCLIAGLVLCLASGIGWGLLRSTAIADIAAASDRATSAESLKEQEAKIDRLIQQLGSPQYAAREKAQSELDQMGLEAFDALNEAQNHNDIEIALRARYLVRGMQVNWARDGDSKRVRELLRDYGGKSRDERENLMQQLAALDGAEGLEALCRLVRYEASPRLSKRAALLVLEMEQSQEEDQTRRFAATIRSSIGLSRRPAASWLMTYAALISGDTAALDRCQQMVQQERQILTRFSEQTSPEINRDLQRWLADELQRFGLEQDAKEAMRQSISLVDGSRPQVLDTVDWLRTREGWDIVVEVAKRFSDTFDRDPLLLYRLAEAELKLDRKGDADRTARRALKAAPNEPDRHLDVAGHLQHDGLFEWAEYEYRFVVENFPNQPAEVVRARLILSEMLHEIQDEAAASELLKQLLAEMESNDQIRKYVESVLGRDEAGIRSRMLFFQSLYHGQQNETEKQRQCLLEGYENFPLDADVLIAMYRLPQADAAWREQVADRITKATAEFRQQITDYKTLTTNSRSFEERAQAAYSLSSAYNQLAWLVSNTEGDFDEALECSKKSLELRPDAAGFLDTLGRCYYAKGDLTNAIEAQSKAAAMEPHSPQILEQLALFKKAKAEQQQDAPEQ
jgi:tetratricopeptide (TPR) repeat protein